MTKSIEQTPDTPEYIEIGFEKGNPVTLNGETVSYQFRLHRNDMALVLGHQ